MRVGAPLLIAGVSIGLIPPAWAQVPAGPAFQVNAYTLGYDSYPHVATESNGAFLVVWNHNNEFSTFPDVFARRFTAGGAAIGEEFRVNAYTTRSQSWSDLSRDARGNAVIVWGDHRSGLDVFGRHVSPAGLALDDDFRASLATTGFEAFPAVAAAPDGRFVVVWENLFSSDIGGQRFDAAGSPVGADFLVNTYTRGEQSHTGVSIDPAGNFTVVWESFGQDAPLDTGVFGQRFDASGQSLGGEFRMNTYTTGDQQGPAVALRRDGSAVVAWEGLGEGGGGFDVWGRRYASDGAAVGMDFRVSAVAASHLAAGAAVAVDEAGNFVVSWVEDTNGPEPLVKARRYTADGTPRGSEFQVAARGAYVQDRPAIASDAVGNFLVAWTDFGPDSFDVFGRRFGGLSPESLQVDATPTTNSDGNGVFEPFEHVRFGPAWRNISEAPISFSGEITQFTGPVGGVHGITDGTSVYPTLSSGSTGGGDGYGLVVVAPSGRPATHWDSVATEVISPDTQGQTKRWRVHLGESFGDVPRTSSFYLFVETLLHRGVTAGCTATTYCPGGTTTRAQMAVFVLVAKEGEGYAPPACTTPVFGDVPVSSPFCRWIEELARRGVTAGCGDGNYCPDAAVSREQMAVFVLRTLDPALDPPACTTPMFEDVPAGSPFCRWIEELARRGVASGCAPGRYCPTDAVTREQMAVFLTRTFGLTLYGP